MRLRVCTIGRTAVYIHVAALVIAFCAALSGTWQVLLCAFASILLHEAVHGVAAALLGQPPEELEITPMGAVIRLEDEMCLCPLRRAVMLAAGPLMTLCLCWLSLTLTAHGWLPLYAGRMLFTSNIAILMMNLLPALPLDGGRLLSLLLSCCMRQEIVARVMRLLGSALGVGAIIGSAWLSWQYGRWNWSLAAAGCFLMYSASTATTTQAMAELRRMLDRKINLEARGHARIRRVAILAEQPLQQAVRLLAPRALTEFLVLEKGTMRPLAILQEDTLISLWLDRPHLTCAEAAGDVNTASPP